MENRVYYYILLPPSDEQYIDFEVGLGQINDYNSVDKFPVFDKALWVCNGEDGFLKLPKGEYKKYI